MRGKIQDKMRDKLSSQKKRKLSSEEISDILSLIPENKFIPEEIAKNTRSLIQKTLREQLEKQVIFPNLIPILKEEIRKNYLSSQMQYGEAVGHITSMALGEKQTQSNLNYFHKAGSGDKKVSSTSRFSDLLNARKDLKNPSFYIYFQKESLNGKEEKTEIESLRWLKTKIGHNLVEINMKKLTKSFQFEVEKKEKPWHEAYYKLYSRESCPYEASISYTINMDILYEYRLTLKEVCDSLENLHSDIYCIPSPDCFGIIDVFVDTNAIELPEEKLLFVTEENKIEIYLEEIVHAVLENDIIKGISGVKNMYFLKDVDLNEVKGETEKWFVETENHNEKNKIKNKFKKIKTKAPDSVKRFKQVLALPFVDKYKTISNSIWDVYHTFGIEAVREYMINEFIETMKGINICHISLLVDKMTFTGSISSVTRFSMKHEGGVLLKSSFEETLLHFMNAGLYGEHEPVKGISAAIICGKRVNAGSGVCDLELDISKVTNPLSLESVKEEEEKEEIKPKKEKKKENRTNTKKEEKKKKEKEVSEDESDIDFPEDVSEEEN